MSEYDILYDMTVDLNESGTSALGSVSGKRRWRVRIIAPGQGSSGFYSEEVLRRDGPRAWPKGTVSHVDHQTFWERDERPERSVTTIAGVLASDPVYEDGGEHGPGLYADMEFTKEWAPFIEQMHEYIGLSISGKGILSDTDTVNDVPVVETLVPYPTNSVDLVTVAGAGGKFIEALEGFRDILEPDIVETIAREEPGMKPEEIEKLAEVLMTSVTEALAPVFEALKAPEIEEVDNAVITEALIEADLPKTARKTVYKAVAAGGKLEEAIAEQKTLIAEVRESLTDTDETGVLQTSGPAVEESFILGGWN